ncbi:MAG: hypothetical protein EOO77_10575 [Oxalobacteraceae bacterium]|jgi:hypothetical protein|uniref:hypothetical protein n=1 Tax=Sphingomonas sp. Leaf208 TaxID=1735679 RepID=UPI0010CFD947|nr:hypothetical protein [Sphingomonas sp. Leaf208]RYF19065.1 MAG: hypothetical protein EOO77_10575 [Oxalobacteraceae bacterium]
MKAAFWRFAHQHYQSSKPLLVVDGAAFIKVRFLQARCPESHPSTSFPSPIPLPPIHCHSTLGWRCLKLVAWPVSNRS